MISILKRVKECELVIQVSDKCGRTCVNSINEYQKQGEVHIGKLKEANWEEIKEANKRLNGTGSVL